MTLKTTFRRLAATALILGVAGGVYAQQTGIPWLNGTRTHSAGVSGIRGTAIRAVGVSSTTDRSYWLREIAFKDVNGQLCAVRQTTSGASADSPSAGLRWTSEDFASTGPYYVGACRNESVFRSAPVRRLQVPSPNHYVRGIRVCTDTATGTATTSIRGVRFQMVEVQGDQLVNATREEMVLSGCEHWHPVVRCPAGELAKGLIGHHGGGAAFRGLELECAPLMNRPGTVSRGDPPNVQAGGTSPSPRPRR